ncbi:MAG: hypothetical protein IKA72_01070, partial [Clostridia bacterium]|nr:hypothetical protein [Clostridia bacterium]
MKKRILGLAALLACTSCFAGCDSVDFEGVWNNVSSGFENVWDKVTDLIPGGEEEVTWNAEAAADMFYELNFDKNEETRNDYTVPNTYNFMKATYTVEWSVDVTNGVVLERGETETTVNVDEMLLEDLDYVLTAKFIAGDKTFAEISFERTVLAMPSQVAAPITDAPKEGVMYKYYVYQTGAQQDCYFIGEMDGYYFKTSTNFEDAVDLYVEYVEGSETDFYLCFNHKDDNSKQYVGVKVSDDGQHNNLVFDEAPVSTFKWNPDLDNGTITTTILDKDGEMSEFYLGNYTNGTKHYTTVSASVIEKATTSNVGHLVALVTVNDVTTTEKLTQAQRNYGLSKYFFGTGTYELPTANETFPDVTYTYKISGEGATLEGNVLSYTAGTEDKTATLTVTFHCGDAPVLTKELPFTVSPIPTVPAAGVLTIADALALDLVAYGNGYNGGKTTEIYEITGIVTSIKSKWDPSYNNMEVFISDDVNGTNSILVYRLGVQVELGDKIKVTGKLGYYNNAVQVAQGATAEIIGKETLPEGPATPDTPVANSTLTITEALTYGATFAHNTYSEAKYYVVGEITEVYNTTYGNMKIKDADGNILTVYGTYSADGSTRYDALETKPVAGDTVKVYGVLGQYNNIVQLKNGWIVEHKAAETPVDPEPEEPTTPDAPVADSTLTITEALTYGATFAHNTYSEGKYYVVGEITEVYNTTYGNMKIKDADGNIRTVYGTYSA